jgi:hypothetical protein
MTKEFPMTNDEWLAAVAGEARWRIGHSGFVIVSSFVIRHSSFAPLQIEEWDWVSRSRTTTRRIEK